MEKSEFPKRLFLEREDLEWLLKCNHGTIVPVNCEYSPNTFCITKTEKYFHESVIDELNKKLELAKEALRIMEQIDETAGVKRVHARECLKKLEE